MCVLCVCPALSLLSNCLLSAWHVVHTHAHTGTDVAHTWHTTSRAPCRGRGRGKRIALAHQNAHQICIILRKSNILHKLLLLLLLLVGLLLTGHHPGTRNRQSNWEQRLLRQFQWADNCVSWRCHGGGSISWLDFMSCLIAGAAAETGAIAGAKAEQSICI